jgi:hypothetical protein
MNLRRGLPRIWILLSAVWIVFWAWQRNVVCELDLPYFDRGPWCVYQFYDWAIHAQTLAIILGPPVLAGFIGWAALCFVSRYPNSN